MRIIGVVSGGFDPLHAGHARMLMEAESRCDDLVVLVNTDEWLLRKKGYVSVPVDQRCEVIRSIVRGADVRPALDDDGTVVASLELIRESCAPDQRVFFFNGGDRGEGNVPEERVEGVRMVYGIGGTDKVNSSSAIHRRGYLSRVQRIWGYYDDHFRTEKCVFKTLFPRDGESTSLQRHRHRSEVWFVESGRVLVRVGDDRLVLDPGDHCSVPAGAWHQMTAIGGDAVVREMQFGALCSEDDIERM